MAKKKQSDGRKKYKVTNWAEYNRALVRRGEIDVWLDADAVAGWLSADPPGPSGGRPKVYSDAAVLCFQSLRRLFRLPLRGAEGLMRSIMRLSGLGLPVPDHATAGRRLGGLKIDLARRPKGKTTVVIDSSGVKVFGEGEWKRKIHGPGAKRRWRKVSIIVGEDGEVRAVEPGDSGTHDADHAAALLGREDAEIEAFHGDGAYDRRKVYDALAARGCRKVLVPPRVDAKIWRHGNLKGPPHPRDENLRSVRKLGMAGWKRGSGYHLRSIVENAFFRDKTIFGERIRSRRRDNQDVEIALGFRMLNLMYGLGRPVSVAVG